MTGPWLIVKWAGLAIMSCYLLLVVYAVRRFRDRFSVLRAAFLVPLLGILAGILLPWIFMKAEVTRICFVVEQATFIYGLVILWKRLARKDEAGSLKADG
jgi:hypothetical protein